MTSPTPKVQPRGIFQYQVPLHYLPDTQPQTQIPGTGWFPHTAFVNENHWAPEPKRVPVMHVLLFPDFESFNPTAANQYSNSTLDLHAYWEALSYNTKPSCSAMSQYISKYLINTSLMRKTWVSSGGQNKLLTTQTTNQAVSSTEQLNNGSSNSWAMLFFLLPSQVTKKRNWISHHYGTSPMGILVFFNHIGMSCVNTIRPLCELTTWIGSHCHSHIPYLTTSHGSCPIAHDFNRTMHNHLVADFQRHSLLQMGATTK